MNFIHTWTWFTHRWWNYQLHAQSWYGNAVRLWGSSVRWLYFACGRKWIIRGQRVYCDRLYLSIHTIISSLPLNLDWAVTCFNQQNVVEMTLSIPGLNLKKAWQLPHLPFEGSQPPCLEVQLLQDHHTVRNPTKPHGETMWRRPEDPGQYSSWDPIHLPPKTILDVDHSSLVRVSQLTSHKVESNCLC